jgi:transposase
LCSKGLQEGHDSLDLTIKQKIKEVEKNMKNTTDILYIGIDVSKDKCDVCIKNQAGNDLVKRFQVSNTKADLNKLYETIEKIKSKNPENSDVVFGMEATGIYYLPLYSALKRDGHKIKLYNPIQTNGFRKMNIRKTKTDPIDAAIIADMLRYSEPPLANGIKDLNIYQLRELVRVRHRLIDKRTRCKIQLIRSLDIVWPGYKTVMPTVFGKTSIMILKKYSVPTRVLTKSFEQFYGYVQKASRSQIARNKAEEIYTHAGNILAIPELESITGVEIKILIAQIELYDGQIQALENKIAQLTEMIDSKIMSVPGISRKLGPIILGEIANVDRFTSAKKLIAFAGLDPVISQSGRLKNKTGPISKRGSPLLRQALFLAANVARQNDENLKRFYNTKIGEGKHHYSALNAVAAKLLRIVFWVLKNNKEYQPQLN